MELLTTNNVWMMVCTALVFFMHLGFSLLEVGLTRQKNAINILFKNVFIICAGLLTYAILGFNLMYPGSFLAGVIPDYFFDLFGLSAPVADGSLDLAYNEGYTYWTDFLFQGMFAATAATIVSGAVAERIKLGSFMLFSVIYITIVYPIVGSWKWGGGFLDGLGFYDFAGSTLVHSVGGWGALIAIYLLGARLGKFGKDGQSHAIPGHNIPLATAGVFILWLGWFGFNGGSVLSADPSLTSITLVTTCLAAAAGGISAFLVSTIAYKNYDLTMFLNGILGGLVGITAGADLMSPFDAVLIGLVAGGVIVFGVSLIDKLKLDDPVGAVAVHLACGIWGTLAVGIFGSMAGFDQFLTQLAGVGIIGAFCCISAFVILSIIKATMGLRMEEKEETEGLDAHEHGMDAYAEFGTVHER
ncbi:ammonium transporter [Salegentibacter mishustinae]|uniref:Ammonium transporter n=1 Tax=Salegentibacter mishustinae TaxID=270918 RepID=A0A0Q9ZNK1_9FLAO|nr:ammonium transporter [Salegentibacter mishustinae]KRG30471.1 ammonium transporter [Salegentibacter mishustinae]PNW23364.1 ammonium transporter [Salegentibacter mishustinae]PZX66431.1 Amt family ammonium transporter [Salegentibacter mishustinae]GGW82486.1 ammonium transporter [Salegentibacter mishustinae]